jgi:hypothetical protein
MKVLAVLAAATVASAIAFGAVAQPAPSPEKVELAKKLVALSGGADQINALMQGVFQNLGASMDPNAPPEQKRMQAAILQKLQARIATMTPKLIDTTISVYADNLSENELRDYVAWEQSDTGQSLKQKLPKIMSQSIQMMAPVLAEVTQNLKQDVIDQACEETHCSAKDREAITAALAKTMPKQPS